MLDIFNKKPTPIYLSREDFNVKIVSKLETSDWHILATFSCWPVFFADLERSGRSIFYLAKKQNVSFFDVKNLRSLNEVKNQRSLNDPESPVFKIYIHINGDLRKVKLERFREYRQGDRLYKVEIVFADIENRGI